MTKISQQELEELKQLYRNVTDYYKKLGDKYGYDLTGPNKKHGIRFKDGEIVLLKGMNE